MAKWGQNTIQNRCENYRDCDHDLSLKHLIIRIVSLLFSLLKYGNLDTPSINMDLALRLKPLKSGFIGSYPKYREHIELVG